jgi:hypothetical protein
MLDDTTVLEEYNEEKKSSNTANKQWLALPC